MIHADFRQNYFAVDDDTGAATIANPSFSLLGRARADLQAVKIEIAIADIKCVGAILKGIPNFVPTKDNFIESGETAIVVSYTLPCV